VPGFSAIAGKSTGPPTGDQLQAVSIECDFDLMGILHASDQIEGVSPQANLDLILAVEREGVRHQDSAARAERQSIEMLVLGEVRADAIDLSAGRDARYCPSPYG
jgi:hypothetical protein